MPFCKECTECKRRINWRMGRNCLRSLSCTFHLMLKRKVMKGENMAGARHLACMGSWMQNAREVGRAPGTWQICMLTTMWACGLVLSGSRYCRVENCDRGNGPLVVWTVSFCITAVPHGLHACLKELQSLCSSEPLLAFFLVLYLGKCLE